MEENWNIAFTTKYNEATHNTFCLLKIRIFSKMIAKQGALQFKPNHDSKGALLPTAGPFLSPGIQRDPGGYNLAEYFEQRSRRFGIGCHRGLRFSSI